jgi:hypothetical protein
MQQSRASGGAAMSTQWTKATLEAALTEWRTGRQPHPDLYGANLSGAHLSRADLSGADLSGAHLSRADLSGANLSGANLSRADLSGANLSGADLSRADLSGANLSGTNLSGAHLSGAHLSRATLSDANLDTATGLHQIVPEVGAFCGFKKLRCGMVACVEIPADSPRVGGWIGRKCRALYVCTLEIVNATGESVSFGAGLHDGTPYVVGELTIAAGFDPDPRLECAGGIHFFLTRREAEEYK